MGKSQLMKILGIFLWLVIASSSAFFAKTSSAQEHGVKVAPLLDGLGDYSYLVSDCSGPAQQFFDQGLRLFYGFYFPEAVASFREAARLDPDCPMTYWGEAMAIAPIPNSRYFDSPDDPKGAGAEAIARASRLVEHASDKERGLLEALQILYDSSAEPESSQRDRGYVNALGALHERYPNDPEVGTLYALALMTASPWDYWTPDGQPRPGTTEAMAALNSVLNGHPEHPGANHLFIHLMENSQHPELALPHAERLKHAMPGAGHIVHMPSHIYIRTGRYAEVVESNQRSLAADRKLVAAWGNHQLPLGVSSSSLSATNHGVHAEDFLHMAAVLQGNYETAIESAQKIATLSEPQLASSGSAQRRYVRLMLTNKRFGKWNRILKEPEPDPVYPFVRGIWHYVRGSAYAATGQLASAQRELTQLQATAEAEGMKELMVRVNSANTLLTLAGHVLTAEIALKQRDLANALGHLESAVRIEDGLRYTEPPDWGHPVRHSLGAVLLEAGRAQEAETVYWEDLRRHPENGWSLYGVWQSLLQQGKEPQAAEVEKRFEKAWANADVTLSNRPLLLDTSLQ